MARREIIQLQGSVVAPIGVITNEARTVVSKICLGIDDIQLLGNKALVLQTEVYPGKLQALYTALASIGIKLNKQSLPEIDQLLEEIEYPLSIQITSFSDDTDRRTNIPKVPG
jgi:hypothetical protein